MAVTADSVVVELIARTEGYTAAVNGAAGATGTAMSRIEQSASRAEAQIVRSSGAMANAQRNLGRQISDIGTQLAGGQSPFLILAQQAPQVADALADTGGKAARVASFFAGPWGAALLAAGSALGVLLSNVLKTGEGVDDLVKKLQDSDTKARLSAQAQAIFEKSLYGSAAASAEMSKRLREQNQSQIQVAQSALAAAQAQRQLSLQRLRDETRSAAIAQSAAASTARRVSNPFLNGDETGAIAPGVAARAINDLTAANKRLAVARRGVADAESAVVDASVPILRLQAAEQADRSAAAVGKHTRAVDSLTDAYRKAQAQAAKLSGAAGNTARAEAVRAYRQGLADEDRRFGADRAPPLSLSGRRGGGGRSGPRTAATEDILDASDLLGDIRTDFDALSRVAGSTIKTESDFLAEAARQFRDVFGDVGDPIGAGVAKYEEMARLEADKRGEADGKLQAIREDNVRSLALMYEDLFVGGTDEVWRNFKDQGLRTIALILAQATVASFGAGGGGFGALLGNIGRAAGAFSGGSLGGLFGRASGGYVGPGQTVRVNEGRGSGVELLRMGAQGGTVIPLGQAAAARPSQSTTVMQTIAVDARGAVMNDQFAAMILSRAGQDARQVVSANNGLVRKGFPATLDRYGKLGTTG